MNDSFDLGEMDEMEKISHDDLEILKVSKSNVIFFGLVGAGKTTLVNKVTGKSFLVRASGFSVTRSIQFAPSKTGKFMAIDGPGGGAAEDVLRHARVQVHLLKSIPFKLVCFVVSGQGRFDVILNTLGDLSSIFREHRENLCVIVTHTDKLHDTAKAELEHVIKNKKKFGHVLCTKSSTRGFKVADWIQRQLGGLRNIEEPVIPSMGLKKLMKYQNSELEELTEVATEEFQGILETYRAFLREKETDATLRRDLYFSLKQQKDLLVHRIYQDGEEITTDLDEVIAETIMFQNAVYDDIMAFKQEAFRGMDLEFHSFNGDNNRYKKCPGCGLIWFKVYGCSSVQCGNRSISRDVAAGSLFNYNIYLLNGKLFVTKKEAKAAENFREQKEQSGLSMDEQEANKSRKGVAQIKPVGCGRSSKWHEWEDVTEWVHENYLKHFDDTSFYASTEDICD